MANRRRLWAESLEDRRMLAAAPEMLTEINLVGDSTPRHFTEVGSIGFFAARDENNGIELWKTDGTASGTVIVADIFPGIDSSYPIELVEVSGTLFFVASDDSGGKELFKSDGTASGTVRVRDIRVGPDGSQPSGLTSANGMLFFTADDGNHGRELWKSDGTDSGTVLVKDIRSGTDGTSPLELTSANGALFFRASDGVNGLELWKSDGTESGTVLVRNIQAGSSSSAPRFLTDVNGTLFFQAFTSASGIELWKSDGTESGTVQVRDINSGTASSQPSRFEAVGATVFFTANDGTKRFELWKSDGTESGTVLVRDINSGANSSYPRSLTDVNGTLFFEANDGVTGEDLWMSDGTESGTVLVRDLPGRFGLTDPTKVNNDLFFVAADSKGESRLWKSDGTESGTVVVRDAALNSISPRDLANVNGTLFFNADDQGNEGREFWKSDGTSSGTVLVKDIASRLNSSYPSDFTDVDGTVFFRADDGVNGNGLWTTDGTAGGNALLHSFESQTNGPGLKYLTEVDGTLFFVADDGDTGYELWKSDGTVSGTVLVRDIFAGADASYPRYLVNVDGTLFFNAFDPTHGRELWKSDGTESGTVLVRNIDTSEYGSYPFALTNLNGMLLFNANDGNSGYELWKSDGTESGTVLVRDINDGSYSSYPNLLTDVNGTLFFRADGGVDGSELWKSDGTESGTVMVRDINDGSDDSYLNQLTSFNGALFFRADDGIGGSELWKSDGTESGTVRVRDIFAGPNGSQPEELTDVNGTLFFKATDGSSGYELWKSDGTESGTVLVRDIDPGPEGSFPYYVTNVNGTVFFQAADQFGDIELWKSDGTASGTVLAGDIVPGPNSSTPRDLATINGTLFFSASTPDAGNEPWVVRPDLDFGDAPAGFDTLLADDGPRHIVVGPRLGFGIDVDQDGQVDADALGDDTLDAGDDEDGVSFQNPFVRGATVNVAVDLQGSDNAVLDYFFDFDGNGVFGNDPNEIFTAVLAAGSNDVPVLVPSNAVQSSTFARFRVSTAGNLTPRGLALDGEVEDYAILIEDTTPPSVTVDILSSTLDDDNNQSSVTFEFSEATTDFVLSDIAVVGGSLSNFSGSGASYTATLTADEGLDGVSVVSVMQGVYTDAAGNAGSSGSDSVTVDTLNPTVVVVIVDDSLSDGDSASLVTFEFSEAVVGFDADDVTVSGGQLSDFLAVDSDSFTATFTADDGVEILGSVGVGIGYTDSAGNVGTSDTDSVTIDTLNPAVTVDIDDTTLISGETATVTFDFSEPPSDFDIDDVTVDNGVLSAIVATGDATVFNATFTPAIDAEAAANSIRVSADYTDASGNVGVAGLSVNYAIDTLAPSLSIAFDDDLVTAGTVTGVTFTFSEVPTGFTTDDVTTERGSLSDLVATADPTVFTASFTADTGVAGTATVSVGSDYTDVAGNAGSGGSDSVQVQTRGIIVSGISGSTTEMGGTATFTIVLTSRPTADVMIALSSSDPGEGTVTSTPLVFTSENWDVPQTVIVTGEDDDVDDGDVNYTILTNAATGGDYEGIDADDVGVTNTDDDVAGFTLSKTTASVSDTGLGDAFTVVLDSQPPTEVVIDVSSGDSGEVTVDNESLTFTSDDWDQPQTVNLAGVGDGEVDGDQETFVALSVNDLASDASFASVVDQEVTVLATDDEVLFDFGDAPASFPVTLAQDGARHLVGPLFLGTSVDTEADGQSSSRADGDGSADDGVVELTTLISFSGASTGSSILVTVSQSAKIDGWIDFDQDGNWLDAGEQIFAGVDVLAGDNLLAFTVPAGAMPGDTFARFRLSSAGSLSPQGASTDGEVEDYVLTIVDGDSSAGVRIDVVQGSTVISRDATDNVVRSGGTELFRALAGLIDSMQINGAVTDDTITIDFASGFEIPSGGMTVAGGDGINTLEITGQEVSLDLTDPNLHVTDIANVSLPLDSRSFVTLDTAAIGRLSPTTSTVTFTAGPDDRFVVKDADDWRMVEPVIVDGKFLIQARNQLGGEVIQVDTPRPYRNPLRLGDVNNDGDVTAGDALIIINELKRRKYSDPDTLDLHAPADVDPWPSLYFDHNGDGQVTALDALRVINELARARLEGAVVGEQVFPVTGWLSPAEPAETIHEETITPREHDPHRNLVITKGGRAIPRLVTWPTSDAQTSDDETIRAVDQLLADWWPSKSQC